MRRRNVATASFSQPDRHPELPLDPDVDAATAHYHGPLHVKARYVYVVFLGGVLGTVARYEAGQIVPPVGGWPLATFAVNMVGCFLLGYLLEALAARGPDHGWLRLARLHFGTGFLGAFTTYSAMAVESVQFAWTGEAVRGAAYLVVTLIVGAGATIAGIRAGSGRRA